MKILVYNKNLKILTIEVQKTHISWDFIHESTNYFRILNWYKLKIRFNSTLIKINKIYENCT